MLPRAGARPRASSIWSSRSPPTRRWPPTCPRPRVRGPGGEEGGCSLGDRWLICPPSPICAAWAQLIGSATATIDAAVFYMTLTDGGAQGAEGQKVFDALVGTGLAAVRFGEESPLPYIAVTCVGNQVAASQRGVQIRLAVSAPTTDFPDTDIAVRLPFARFISILTRGPRLQMLQQAAPSVQVTYVNMTKIFGDGVMHAKFLVTDNSSFYLGSANFGRCCANTAPHWDHNIIRFSSWQTGGH